MPTASSARPTRRLARLDRARDAHPVRRLGLDLPRRSRSRSRPSRRSSWRRSGSCSPARSCSAGSPCAGDAPGSGRRAASGGTAGVVGALLLGGGMGIVASGRADRPVRDHRPRRSRLMPVWVAMLRPRSCSASGCPRWPSSASSSGSSASRILVGPTVAGGDRRARSGRARCSSCCRRSRGRSARCSPRIGRPCPRDPLVEHRRRRWSSAAVVLVAHGAVDRRVRPVRSRPPCTRPSRSSRFVYLDGRRQPARVHDVRLAAAGRAAAARRDVRLRQPGRRGHPRRDRPATSRSMPGRSRRPRSSSGRSRSS